MSSLFVNSISTSPSNPLRVGSGLRPTLTVSSLSKRGWPSNTRLGWAPQLLTLEVLWVKKLPIDVQETLGKSLTREASCGHCSCGATTSGNFWRAIIIYGSQQTMVDGTNGSHASSGLGISLFCLEFSSCSVYLHTLLIGQECYGIFHKDIPPLCESL